jgi:hypothetical protein
MRRAWGTKTQQWAKVVIVIVLGVLIGAAVAIASSPASLK